MIAVTTDITIIAMDANVMLPPAVPLSPTHVAASTNH
jgi:hypothetical protein